ncbi:hypothetical protein [Hyphomicrobium sulfonivorans]|uniref:Uncharacterized protein n=1 Tax=Hyphomicrobium sulfonivorans TaxID=121290 RepID=A0A109B9X3_HYPSL|nr:hypothetical protein [Hyphomicrobium sulfonivorans]KWT64687.1 hypothetical protein APY04_3159 [Hyphomicrobium sulfonivorans]MBI1649739.1 hypothetical protein [Hyphomicrobium sulfonivorans]NSL71653.1 hypothetical protein [Hyphomicrobium sulfonivorans]
MAKAPYRPPVQSQIGQIFDTLFLLALVLASLFAPLYLGLAGSGKTTVELSDTSWAGMKQNATMQAQWEKLGYTDGTEAKDGRQPASKLIATRFDYDFSFVELAASALVVIAYFFIVFYWSKKEYREVIDERFGNSE